MSSKFFRGGLLKVFHLEKKNQNNIFNLQLFFMKLVGQIPVNLEYFVSKKWQRATKLFAIFYCTFSIASTLHLALLFLKTTYDMLQIGELEEITDALTMTIIYSFATFATCYWFSKVEFLSSFLMDINKKHMHQSKAGWTYVCADNSYKLSYKITFYWLSCCMVGVVSWALNPILLGAYSLPLKCWYPFNPMRPVVYELTYASQVWCQFIMGCIFGNGSALFVSIIIVLLGQFDILYCNLKNLNCQTLLMPAENVENQIKIQSELLKEENNELNQYVVSKEYSTNLNVLKTLIQNKQTLKKDLNESLVECIQLHQSILRSCNKLEDLFNPYCLIKSLQITLQLCLLVFVGVAGENSTMRKINLIQYLALTLSELFMFTFFGELLRSHSVRASDAFFRSRWWPYSHCVKQEVLIFLINSKRAVKLTAGKFYLMDIERLRSVIAQAFSFLTLLQKLAEKNV